MNACFLKLFGAHAITQKKEIEVESTSQSASRRSIHHKAILDMTLVNLPDQVYKSCIGSPTYYYDYTTP